MPARAPHLVTTSVTCVVLTAACSSEGECVPRPSPATSCPDLTFQGRGYVEWREIEPPTLPQEVGNATYPACNAAETCAGTEFEGFRGTDVWLLDGVALTDAVMALREGTHTYVVFVRVGVDPTDL